MTYYTAPKINKHSDVFLSQPWESTPVVVNSTPYLVSFKRNWTSSSGIGLRITNLLTNTIVLDTSTDWGGFLGCAYVDTFGVLHIFGVNNDSSNGNSVMHATVDTSAWTISSAASVLTVGATQRAYNCSVCASPNGYTMALELASNNVIFFQSSSLTSDWTQVGIDAQWSANPTIRYMNGYYYLMIGANSSSRVDCGRTTDLSTTYADWEWANPIGSSTVVAPDGPGNESTCASDWDHVEYSGEVLACYLIGDQSTYAYLKTASYPGTEQEFLEGLF